MSRPRRGREEGSTGRDDCQLLRDIDLEEHGGFTRSISFRTYLDHLHRPSPQVLRLRLMSQLLASLPPQTAAPSPSRNLLRLRLHLRPHHPRRQDPP